MTKGRKVVIGIGVALLIGILAVQALRQDAGGVEVRAEEVQPRDLVARVSATGHIEAKRRVELRAEVPGRILRLPVEEGQDVREGDLLVELEPIQYEAAVRRARAVLSEAQAREAQARASYLQASRDADRFRRLKEATPDLVTAQEVERAVTDAEVQRALYQAAEHSVEQARAALEEAQDRLDKTVIRSPMSGRITRLDVEAGETVIMGGFLDPLLMTVSDLSVMEAVIEVDETDIPAVSLGDSAAVEIDAFPNRRFAGRVTKVGTGATRPRGGQQQQQQPTDRAVDFEVRITLEEPPPGIRPDLSATADIVTANRTGVLSIPIASLTLLAADQIEELPAEGVPEEARPPIPATGDVEGVFVVEDDRVRFRAVEVGIAGEHYFEVLRGLHDGDLVVSGSYQAIRELRDGSRVKVVATDRADRPADASGASVPADSPPDDASDGETSP